MIVEMEDLFLDKLLDLAAAEDSPELAILKVFDEPGPENMAKADIIKRKVFALYAIMANACPGCTHDDPSIICVSDIQQGVVDELMYRFSDEPCPGCGDVNNG